LSPRYTHRKTFGFKKLKESCRTLVLTKISLGNIFQIWRNFTQSGHTGVIITYDYIHNFGDFDIFLQIIGVFLAKQILWSIFRHKFAVFDKNMSILFRIFWRFFFEIITLVPVGRPIRLLKRFPARRPCRRSPWDDNGIIKIFWFN
jgi:hypothetical protein